MMHFTKMQALIFLVAFSALSLFVGLMTASKTPPPAVPVNCTPVLSGQTPTPLQGASSRWM